MVAFDQAVMCGEIQHFIIPRQHKWFKSKKKKNKDCHKIAFVYMFKDVRITITYR